MTAKPKPAKPVAASHHKLTRGRVWCTTRGRSLVVNAGECMKHGWPKCCGLTMTIDSPEERNQLARVAEGRGK